MVAVLSVSKVYAARVVALGDADALRALLLEGGFALLLPALLAFAAPARRRWAWLAADALVAVVCLAVVMHVRVFEQVPTLASLAVARELPVVREAVGALFEPVDLLFLAGIPPLAAAAVLSGRRTARAPLRRSDPRLLAAVALSSVWALLPVAVLATGGPIDDSIAGARRNGLIAFALHAPADAEPLDLTGEPAPAPPAGPVSSDEPTASPVSAPPRRLPVDFGEPETVQARIDYLQRYAGSERVTGAPEPGSAAGRSVVIVQMEALGSWAVGREVLGEEVTPNLARLAGESWYAPHTVTQIGRGNTSDAEFTANTSQLAHRNDPSGLRWGGKEVPSLPRLVRARGYDAVTYHANVISYWRRDSLYPALGFSEWFARFDGIPDREIVGGIGPSDAVLFETVADDLVERHATGERFLAEVVALSAHFPYRSIAPRSDLRLPPELRGTVLGQYLQAMRYQDAQLGAFVERLRREDVLDDVVLVVYGDHFGVRPYGRSSAGADALGEAEREYLAELLGREPGVRDNFEVPLLVRLPGTAGAGRVEAIRGQVDIMPTVADLLGLDLGETPHVGASLFDDRPRTVVMRYHTANGTFVTDEHLFRPGVGYDDAAVFRLSDSTRVPPAEVPRDLYKRMHQLGRFSNAYLDALPDRVGE